MPDSKSSTSSISAGAVASGAAAAAAAAAEAGAAAFCCADAAPCRAARRGVAAAVGVPVIKAPFIKFCKAFEKRLSSSVPSHRVIPVNEEQPTNLDVAGFITKWKSGKGKNILNPLNVELQFLEHLLKNGTLTSIAI